MLYADAGYADYAYEGLFTEASGCLLLVARKCNSKRPHDPAQAHLIQHYRKDIETQFSVLTGRFPKKTHAVTAGGFVSEVNFVCIRPGLCSVGVLVRNLG